MTKENCSCPMNCQLHQSIKIEKGRIFNHRDGMAELEEFHKMLDAQAKCPDSSSPAHDQTMCRWYHSDAQPNPPTRGTAMSLDHWGHNPKLCVTCESLEYQLLAADELAKAMVDASEDIHCEFCGPYEHELCKKYKNALTAYEKVRRR